VGITRTREIIYTRWQPLGIPFAIAPLGQLYQSPPSPIPGGLGRGLSYQSHVLEHRDTGARDNGFSRAHWSGPASWVNMRGRLYKFGSHCTPLIFPPISGVTSPIGSNYTPLIFPHVSGPLQWARGPQKLSLDRPKSVVRLCRAVVSFCVVALLWFFFLSCLCSIRASTSFFLLFTMWTTSHPPCFFFLAFFLGLSGTVS